MKNLPLPKGWQEVKLKDLFNNFSEKNHADKIILASTQDRGVIPNYMLGKDILRKEDSLSNYKLVKKGCFIISLRSFQGGFEYSNYEGIVSPAYTILEPKIKFESIFYKFYFKSHYFINKSLAKYVEGIRDGRQIRYEECKDISVPFPPLDEQKRIAEVLSLCDEVIENLTKLIEKKELYKKGIMQRVLSGEVRFKGFKDEWTFKSLEKICSIKKGEQKNKLDLVENGKYPVLSGGMDFSGYYNSYNREANTITISEGGNSCGYVNFIKTKFWASGHCYTLHDVNIDNLFLYQCLKYNENKIMKLRLGSGLPNIQLSYIREYTLKIPKSIEEQKKIAGLLSVIDDDIDNLKKQLE
ncbi:restriction endonuclease subunit S, partial [Brachyspira hampsonii]|uniref:restriction endonuclease subunit S n=1 Tax=Brachyspira hampsonii TaxID=1287055 RepID=UPI001CA5EB6F